MQWAARVPGLLAGLLQSMRLRPLRRTPIAYGWLIKHDLAGAPLREWVDPFLSNPEIRRDTGKVLRGINPRHTFDAAEKLRAFDRPALLAWAVEDRFFKLSIAERLTETIRGATLETIEDSYTFVRRLRGLDQQPRSFALRLTVRPSSEVATASTRSPDEALGR